MEWSDITTQVCAPQARTHVKQRWEVVRDKVQDPLQEGHRTVNVLRKNLALFDTETRCRSYDQIRMQV